MVSADTINTFKNRLDKFWSDQEVLYVSYNTDLHGIGNRRLLWYFVTSICDLYVYFSDTEASQACFRLLRDDDYDEV